MKEKHFEMLIQHRDDLEAIVYYLIDLSVIILYPRVLSIYHVPV